MARTKTVQETPKTNLNENSNEVNKINIKLEKENAELKSEVESIKQMLAQLVANQNTKTEQNKVENEQSINIQIQNSEDKYQKYINNYEEVSANKRIPVVSLYNGLLGLTTDRKGGVPYEFETFGEKKLIKYSHLSDILTHYGSFSKIGYFYIEDDHVVANHGLVTEYETLLSKNDFDNLFKMSEREMLEKFRNTTEQQREEFMSVLYERISNGEDVDRNKFEKLKKTFKRKAQDDDENY